MTTYETTIIYKENEWDNCTKTNAIEIEIKRVMIFEHPLETTLVTTSFLSLFIGQKHWKEKNGERE